MKNFCSGLTGFQVSPAGLTRGFQKFCLGYGFYFTFAWACSGFTLVLLRVCSGLSKYVPGSKEIYAGVHTFSRFNIASNLNTAVACLFMSENRLADFFCIKVCHVNITFYSIFSVHITFYGTVQCLGEDGTWKQEMVSAEIDSGPDRH